jgi:hypothetical protein
MGAIFKPLLNSSQWPMYEGLNYVPDMSMRKMRKGGGGRRRSISIMKWMTFRRVTIMICIILVTSTKTKLKYIVQSLMVNATPWK